jgi:hypothetical protein
VSKRGADASAALAAFRSEVVDKLLAAGAHPFDRSKTELGTECKGAPSGGSLLPAVPRTTRSVCDTEPALFAPR